MLIFLLRHGLTDWNVARLCQGTTDIPLNAEGIAQAQTLAARCESLHIERFYHSPLSRAAKTAELASAACHAPMISCPDLREVCLGVFQGLSREQACAAYPTEATAYFSNPESIAPPQGESMLDVQRRALSALDFAEKDAAGCQRIALVSHGAWIKSLICAVMDMPLHQFSRFDIGNCSLSVLESVNGHRRLLTLNDLSHFADPYNEKMASTRLLI